MILIVSRDKDFSHSLAEQVKKELALNCHVAESGDAARTLAPPPALVVTSDAGAVKYDGPVLVVKNPPVRMRDVLADVRAMLHKPSDSSMDLGHGYGLQLRQKQLTYAGKATGLTDKEAQLLQCLAEAGSKGASKDRLLKTVWDIDAALDTHTLETHIYRLRGKLRELAGDDTMIIAVEGGYKWMDKQDA